MAILGSWNLRTDAVGDGTMLRGTKQQDGSGQWPRTVPLEGMRVNVPPSGFFLGDFSPNCRKLCLHPGPSRESRQSASNPLYLFMCTEGTSPLT